MDPIDTVLEYIGFDAGAAQKVGNEIERGQGLLKAFAVYDKKRAKELATDMKEKPAGSKVIIGSKRTDRIRAVAHWINDRLRCNEEPDINGMDEDEFMAAISQAAERDRIRQASKESNETLARRSFGITTKMVGC